MTKQDYKKHRLNKTIDLLKYCFTLVVLSFFVIQAPNEASKVATTVGAFVLGGSKVRGKLGL